MQFSDIKNKSEILKTIIILVLVYFAFLQGVSASEPDIDEMLQYECGNLIQTCADCSYVNFTSVLLPNKSLMFIRAEGEKDGTDFYTEFCNTELLGIHYVNGNGDLNGQKATFNYKFKVVNDMDYEDDMMWNLSWKDPFIIVVFVIICLICVALFIFGQNVYAGGVITIVGFVMLFNGVTFVFSLLMIYLGVLIGILR